jgi:proteasome lid subunit RPN8/RPN11
MMLRVTREALGRMRAEAAAAGGEECCGLLLGVDHQIDEARPAINVAADRRKRFEIDPQSLVDAHRAARRAGPAIIGYYHSHPAGPAMPSATDRAMAAGDGLVWAIVGEDGVTFWRDDGQGFARLSYVVEDR